MHMTEFGGSDFNPGEAYTLKVTGLSSTESTASIRYESLEVDGSHSGGGSWDFAFTADESGYFDPTPNRWAVQVVYGSGAVHEIVVRTGVRKNGTVPSDPGASTQVTSVTAGDGLSASPNPITGAGTISRASEPVPQNGAVNTRTLVDKAWSPAQSALATVKRQSWYHATGGSGGGAAELISSGVEYVVQCGGYWINGSTSLKESIDPQWIEVDSSGTLDFNRSTHPGAGGDGYFIWCDYVETT